MIEFKKTHLYNYLIVSSLKNVGIICTNPLSDLFVSNTRGQQVRLVVLSNASKVLHKIRALI